MQSLQACYSSEGMGSNLTRTLQPEDVRLLLPGPCHSPADHGHPSEETPGYPTAAPGRNPGGRGRLKPQPAERTGPELRLRVSRCPCVPLSVCPAPPVPAPRPWGTPSAAGRERGQGRAPGRKLRPALRGNGGISTTLVFVTFTFSTSIGINADSVLLRLIN